MGKEILIKAVTQVIPTYVISCFQLPTALCKEVESMIRRFWWGGDEHRKTIHSAKCE